MGLLTWAIIALVVSIIAGAMGFTGVASGAKSIAKVLFGIFLIIALILFLLLVLGTNVVEEANAYSLLGRHVVYPFIG
jgi:uncharacterized membrane protein YtjA (UPF0391 family)